MLLIIFNVARRMVTAMQFVASLALQPAGEWHQIPPGGTSGPWSWWGFLALLFTSPGGLLILGLAIGVVVQTVRLWRLQRTRRR
jgi:hypothetical protein